MASLLVLTISSRPQTLWGRFSPQKFGGAEAQFVWRRTAPICIFQSRDPLGTNKNDGAGWRKLRAAICAIIFAVPRPLLQSPEGDYDGAISQSRGLEK